MRSEERRVGSLNWLQSEFQRRQKGFSWDIYHHGCRGPHSCDILTDVL